MEKRRVLSDIFYVVTGLAIAAEVYLDTGPLVCLADPTCRALTTDEVGLARTVFGDAIRYDDVRVFERKPFLKSGAEAYAIRNNIYLPQHAEGQDDVRDDEIRRAAKEGFSGYKNRPVLMHEMIHIWQYQHDGMKPGGLSGRYSIEAGKAFGAYNREQQATIVEDYVRDAGTLKVLRALPSPEGVEVVCRNLTVLENVLKPVFPVAVQHGCPRGLP